MNWRTSRTETKEFWKKVSIQVITGVKRHWPGKTLCRWAPSFRPEVTMTLLIRSAIFCLQSTRNISIERGKTRKLQWFQFLFAQAAKSSSCRSASVGDNIASSARTESGPRNIDRKLRPMRAETMHGYIGCCIKNPVLEKHVYVSRRFSSG